jgi:peptidyl-tRNA hydrolase, PTH1 family
VRAVLGIGNMGLRYQRNRHNAGFLILDYFAQNHFVKFKAAKGDYYISEGELNRTLFFLIKPSNYVNNSGVAAAQFLEKHKIDILDLLVVCDDVNLKLGKIRVRRNGGDGGHNGLASIIYHLNSDQFPRLRVGIGNDFKEGELSSFVLDDFNEDENKILKTVLEDSSFLIEEFISGGIEAMLNANSKLYNSNDSSTRIN